jgi:hypothetical protein
MNEQEIEKIKKENKVAKLFMILYILITCFSMLMYLNLQFFDASKFSSTYGYYGVTPEKIVIYSNKFSYYMLDFVYFHEKCHHIWYVRLNDEQRKEYTSIFKNADSYVDDYAKTSLEEDFAETCATYILDTNPIDEQRTEFLDKISYIQKVKYVSR